ncbi:hypothetical protein LPJ66_008400, partial [Kickxella alabastrina]
MGEPDGTVMTKDSVSQYSADEATIDSSNSALTPNSRCAYDIPNDNENDGQYATEFWLNALVPKPHTNFFGYEASIGPICISISTRESHECYKALVRTPFKFSVVYVPTIVIDEPVFGTDLDRLSSPTPQKMLLYHAMRLYFQQADDERRGYLLTALRNRCLAVDTSSAGVGAFPEEDHNDNTADAMWGRSVIETIRRTNTESEARGDAAGRQEQHGQKQRAKRGLQRSNTKRSIELRRAEISDFMDGLFKTGGCSGGVKAEASASQASTLLVEGGQGDTALLMEEIQCFLAAEREQRDLAVATESLTEIRDDHLKPLLRNLEPRLFRRRLRIDFVVVGAAGQAYAANVSPPHQRFLRSLERANLRMRGESGSGAKVDAKANTKAESKTAQRQKTREELEAKRTNIIQELIATERSYVEKLRALIDIYVVPLRSAARSANNTLIPAYDAHVIFGNIERVSEVNERFLGDLEAWAAGEMDPRETIGSLCRDHFVDFHVYKRYINGYQHALATSRELEAKNPLYAAFLNRAREREECRKLGISDLLIMPVQRIPRYTLLLTDLLKATVAEEDEVACIQLALERVNEIGQLADNQVAESVAELHRIHTTVEGCPPNLISASREFIGAIDASEIDLATSAPKRPVSLLVFSDLLMVVERFWPPRDHGGIRVTAQPALRHTCPVHASVGAGTSTALETGSGADYKTACTCGIGPNSGSSSSIPAATAFLSTTSDSSRGKRWGRFAGWVDITRVSTLEKSLNPSSRSFYIHRYPSGGAGAASGADDVQAAGAVARLRAATVAPSANPSGQRSSASSIVSLESGTATSPALPSEMLHQEFARILYPAEATYESYGDHGYWYPQSLHEFETDHPLTRDAFFEFLNIAWERSIARCFESTSLGHPELDRVDVGGQAWTVRIWDAADYARSRHSCPSALAADMTVVWDYSQMGSPAPPAGPLVYFPQQACRIIDSGDGYFDVVSTVLPLDSQLPHSTETETYAELLEERDVADNWPALCRLVEQAVTMYQYVLLAYPEHRRVQQCYNRSILASLFGQNALGSSSSVKAETAVSAAPRKLFSRARHLFSSGKLRSSGSSSASVSGSGTQKGASSADSTNLFSSAYSNAVTTETISPSSGSSPYNHSTISTPLTVLGRYKLKGKSSTMVPSRRANTLQPDPQASQLTKTASAGSTPSHSSNSSAHAGKPALATSSSFSAGDASKFGIATTSGSTSTRLSPIPDNLSSGRKIAHTIDEFPPFSSTLLADNSLDIRTRSQTSWEQRARAATSMPSMAQGLPVRQQSSRVRGSQASKDTLSVLPLNLSGSSPSLVKLEKQASSSKPRSTGPDGAAVHTKRRSMSVVEIIPGCDDISLYAAPDLGSVSGPGSLLLTTQRQSRNDSTNVVGSIASIVSSVSATASNFGACGPRGDSGSEFSLSLDILQPHGESLDIPDDLKLEFDAALSGDSSTPPHSEHGLALNMQSFVSPFPSAVSTGVTDTTGADSRHPFKSGAHGLSVFIPSNGNVPNTSSTWDIVSPEYIGLADQHSQLPLKSADSAASSSMFSSSQGTPPATVNSGRGTERRRGVYGAPPHKTATADTMLMSTPRSPRSDQQSRAHIMLSESDILLDIARELGEDESFAQPANISSLYVDEDDVARHLGRMSISNHRPQTSPGFPQHGAVLSLNSSDRDTGSTVYLDTLRPLPSVPMHSKSLNYGSERHAPSHPRNQAFGTMAPSISGTFNGPSAWTMS